MADLQAQGSADAVDLSLWPEDTVEYRLHCSPSGLGAGGAGRPPSDDLSQLAVECNYVCKRLSGNHVWHYAGVYLRPDTSGVYYSLGLKLDKAGTFFKLECGTQCISTPPETFWLTRVS